MGVSPSTLGISTHLASRGITAAQVRASTPVERLHWLIDAGMVRGMTAREWDRIAHLLDVPAPPDDPFDDL